MISNCPKLARRGNRKASSKSSSLMRSSFQTFRRRKLKPFLSLVSVIRLDRQNVLPIWNWSILPMVKSKKWVQRKLPTNWSRPLATELSMVLTKESYLQSALTLAKKIKWKRSWASTNWKNVTIKFKLGVMQINDSIPIMKIWSPSRTQTSQSRVHFRWQLAVPILRHLNTSCPWIFSNKRLNYLIATKSKMLSRTQKEMKMAAPRLRIKKLGRIN